MRIGYYYRWVVHLQDDIAGCYILRIPIARYLCREKQKRKHRHRTFSLLPDTLIPFYAITIDTLVFIMSLLLIESYSPGKALNSLDAVSPEDILFSKKSLLRYSALFEQTRIKLILFFQKPGSKNRGPPGIESFTRPEILDFIIHYSREKQSDIQSNACNLSRFYYSRQGTYMKNAHFLFGTAAQFR